MALFARGSVLIGLVGLVASFAGCSGSMVDGGAEACEYAGERHALGDTFPDADGCNQCSCTKEGVACTTKACVDDGCSYEGQRFAVGDSFPASDGCNQCSCESGGSVACTEKGCGDACESIEAERQAELAKVQQCTTAADCGQQISGSSCGCTRNLVARNDANLDHYLELQKSASEACGIGGSTCDCPAADGFACKNQRCTWNYTNEPEPDPACQNHEPGVLCVRGTPTEDGETLEVGDVLSVSVQSKGCFSSSCTKVQTAECGITEGEAFEVEASFCVANTAQPGEGCTADCGSVAAKCSFGQGLSAGEHQVRLGSVVVGFQVPTKLPFGGLCAGEAF